MSYQSLEASDVSIFFWLGRFNNHKKRQFDLIFLEMTSVEYILQISSNVELEGHVSFKDQPSNIYLVSTDKASILHSPNVQIASTRLLLCASYGNPELSNNEER